MVFDLNFDKLVALCSWSFTLRCNRAGTLGRAVDDQGVVVVGFDGDVVDCCSWEVAVEIVVMGVFFEVETGDKAVHEAVTTGEMAAGNELVLIWRGKEPGLGYIARDGQQLKDTRVTILLKEYVLEFIDVIQDWGEITIDSSSVSECRGELRERGHFRC